MVFAAQAGALAFLFVSVAAAQSSRPVDPGEMKHAERLQTEAKGIDADAAKAMSPEGQQRITDTIAKQFKVDPSVVTNLRNRRIGFGEATVALALSQELMKQDKSLTQQRALDQVLAKRAGGEGWGRIAQDLGLKLGRVRAEVERAEEKVAAEQIARGTDGVRGVNNVLQVVPEGQRRLVDARDGDIKQSVKNRLETDAMLREADINVRADAGMITLKGSVPDARARNRAADLARGVSGVKSVRNELKSKDTRAAAAPR